MSYSPSVDVMQKTIVAARAQLDDLQAELEAGARFALRIEDNIAALDVRLGEHQNRFEALQELVARVADLRSSVREQRSLMSQLRASLDDLRRQTGDLRSLR